MSAGNQYGHLCPNCYKGTELLITASAEVLLTPTGTDIDTDTIPAWNNASYVDCLVCGWEGTVGGLVKVASRKKSTSERNNSSGRLMKSEPKIK
jgi:hypothetical protein